MKITTVTVSYSRRFNLEQYGGPRYESIEPATSITAELDEGDDPAAVTEQLSKLVRESVKAQALPVLDAYRKRVDQIRDSLPADVQSTLE